MLAGKNLKFSPNAEMIRSRHYSNISILLNCLEAAASCGGGRDVCFSQHSLSYHIVLFVDSQAGGEDQDPGEKSE